MLKTGTYRMAAWSRNHTAEREDSIGSSHLGVMVWINEDGLEILLSVV